jgi:hypothetical protein
MKISSSFEVRRSSFPRTTNNEPRTSDVRPSATTSACGLGAPSSCDGLDCWARRSRSADNRRSRCKKTPTPRLSDRRSRAEQILVAEEISEERIVVERRVARSHDLHRRDVGDAFDRLSPHAGDVGARAADDRRGTLFGARGSRGAGAATGLEGASADVFARGVQCHTRHEAGGHEHQRQRQASAPWSGDGNMPRGVPGQLRRTRRPTEQIHISADRWAIRRTT